MTVGELRDRMSNQEFVEWRTYLGRQAQREEMQVARQKGRR